MTKEIHKMPNLFQNKYLNYSDALIEKLKAEIEEKEEILKRVMNERNMLIFGQKAYSPMNTLKELCKNDDKVASIGLFDIEGNYFHFDSKEYDMTLDSRGKLKIHDIQLNVIVDSIQPVGYVDVAIEKNGISKSESIPWEDFLNG
jgi:hypothetical protein